MIRQSITENRVTSVLVDPGEVVKTHLEFLLGSKTPLLDVPLQSTDWILRAPHPLDFLTRAVGSTGVGHPTSEVT